MWTTITGSSVLPYIRHPHDRDLVIWCSTREEYSYIGNHLRLVKEQCPEYHVLLREYPQDMVVDHISYLYYFINDPRLICNIYDTNNVVAILNRCMHIVARYTVTVKKCYYHVYTMCCMLINGNYSLSDDEIERINRFHDQTNTEEDYQIMLQKLEEAKAKYLPQQ